jgi:hypothetical protein
VDPSLGKVASHIKAASGVVRIHRTSVGLLLEDQLGTKPPSIVYGNAGNSPIGTSTPAGRLNLF